MSKQSIECDDSRLDLLLNGDERSEEFLQLSKHLDSCAHCQIRLTELAANSEEWDDVSSLLRGYDMDSESVFHNPASSYQSGMKLDFLSAPSHPEMLGLLGRYEIEKVIGSGGMGIVLKGYDKELNRPVAIKVLAPYLAHSGAARKRFAREGRAAAAVVNEHVVAIYNVETDAEVPFMVMQFVSGQSLQARVDEHGPLEYKEILRIGIQAAAGLTAAHEQGVIHRDVKPSNILLENDVERALLTDFGLARVVDDATVTRTGVVAGTPHYMSPEQALGESINHRSDLFSLGALLYFMATGHPPFRAERALAVLNRICNESHRPVEQINPDIPDELSDIIDQLLEKKPDRRFTSAEKTHDALLKLLERAQQPGTIRRRRRVRRWLRNYRNVIPNGVIASVSLVIFLLALAWIYYPKNTSGIEFTENGKMESALKELNASPKTLTQDLKHENGQSYELVTGIKSIENELETMEAENSLTRQFFLHDNRDIWNAEIEAIHRQLSDIEKKVFNRTYSQNEKK